jgi:hypothetical protein
MADMKADAEKNAKEMAAAGMKAQADQYMKSALAQLNDPNTAKFKRVDIEQDRAHKASDQVIAQKAWELLWPPDPMTVVARHLREFVSTTTDVDFAAKRHVGQGEGGSALVFDNAAYNQKPWQWRFAYEFGPEAIGAARAAAQAWQKELQAK